MMSKFGRFVLAGLALACGPAAAQESSSVVEVKNDWAVFAEPDPKQCWAVTAPSGSVATRDGAPVDVRRGEVQMFVTFRPADGVAGEISFTGGYPFDKNAPLTVSVDGHAGRVLSLRSGASELRVDVDFEVSDALEKLDAELRAERKRQLDDIGALLDGDHYEQAGERVRQLMFVEKFGEEVGRAVEALEA